MKNGAEIVVILQNIRSAHNVGSIFRSADGAGISKLFLCGYTPGLTDKFGRIGKPQKEIAKTALGAEKIIPYEMVEDFTALIKRLKGEGHIILALEQDKKSIKLFSNFNDEEKVNIVNNNAKNDADQISLKKILSSHKKIALCLGEEVNGFRKEELLLVDTIIEIPMKGEKESLNVSVAGGIAMFVLSQSIS